MTPSSSRRIAIVGAGPAGLTAARILQLRGLHVAVFEADASSAARDQGGTLDLHADMGQRALELAGLHTEFAGLARYDDQNTRVLDYATAQPLFEETPPPGSRARPEIDRKVLRDLLLSSLAPDSVRWGHKLLSVQAHGEGRHMLTFANGYRDTFELVIGAEGAWSKVRAALSATVPEYSGLTFVECRLDEVDTRHPAIARLVGHGTMFALHDGMGLIAQRNGNGHVRLYAALRRPPDWAEAQGIGSAPAARARAALLLAYGGWAPELLSLIASCLDDIIARPIFSLPATFQWPARAGLTLIGDAAHLMPPVGVGVNLAMLDGAELAMAVTPDGDWQAQVSHQESLMRQRALRIAPEAITGFAEMFSADAPAAVLEQMRSRRD